MKDMITLTIVIFIVSMGTYFVTKEIERHDRENELKTNYLTYKDVFNGKLDYDLWKQIYTYNRNSIDVKR